MSYLMSQMMRRKEYPLEHELSEEKFKKLIRKQDYKGLTFDEYRNFLTGSDERSTLLHEFEIFEEDFKTRGQFLNWVVEKRLKDGRII